MHAWAEAAVDGARCIPLRDASQAQHATMKVAVAAATNVAA